MSLVQNLLSQGTIERLGWMLVHFLWQATAVVLLLAVILRLLRRADANLRYIIGCLALGLIVVLPLVTIQLVEVPQPVAALPATVPASGLMPSTPAIVEIVDEIPAFGGTAQEPVGIAAPIPWQERLIAGVEPALPYVVLGWLAGVFSLSAWHLGGWVQLQRLKRRMVCEVEAALRQRLAELSERLGVHRAVRLLESAVVEVPTVVGWLRPVILLPASALTGLSTEQLEAILAHELAHIRRCDYLVNVLQTIVEILGFYHPAVWWVSYRIRIERENCCDDLAVRVCGSSLQYARALTSMEEIRHRPTDLALAAAGGSLMSRIARLLGRPAGDDRRFTWLLGLLALLVVIGLVIPAALALGVPNLGQPDSTVAEAPSENAIVPSDEARGQPDPNEPPRVQVATTAKTAPAEGLEAQLLLDFRLIKARTDKRLDRETVLQIENILGESVQLTNEDAGARQEPRITLGEVLRKHIAGKPLPQETVQALNDLLLSKGYVEPLANPQMQARDGQKAQVAVATTEYIPTTRSGDDSSGPPQLEKVECGTRLAVTAHLGDRNTTTLELAVELTDIVRGPNDTDLPLVRTMAIESTMTVPNDRYFSLLAEPAVVQGEQTQDGESILVMVKPSIVEPALVPADQAAAQTQRIKKRSRQVLLDVRTVALERSDLPVVTRRVARNAVTVNDGGTVALAGLVRKPAGQSGLPARVLAVFVTAHCVSEANLIDVLTKLSHQSDAKICVDNTVKPVPVSTGFDLTSVSVPTALRRILKDTEYRLQVTDKDTYRVFKPITLSFEGTDLRQALHDIAAMAGVPIIPDPNVTGTVYADIREQPLEKALEILLAGTPYAVKKKPGPLLVADRRSKLYVGRRNTGASWTERVVSRSWTFEGHQVIVRLNYVTPEQAKKLLSPAFEPFITINPTKNTNPDYHGHVLTVTAPPDLMEPIIADICRIDVRPRQMLLDARVVVVERKDLLNLGITWASPTFGGGASSDAVAGNTGDDANDTATRIQAGCTPDRAGTDALLTALNRLCADHRAETISTLQELTQDGREGRFWEAGEEGWFWVHVSKNMIICGTEPSRTEHGPIVSIVPHVGGGDDIILETAIDVNGSMRRGGLYDILSVLSTASAAVAIQDGGTLVWAGLPQKVPSRETAIFVTVRLIPVTRQQGDE